MKNAKKVKNESRAPWDGAGHSWITDYGAYRRDEAVQHATENSPCDAQHAGAILDARNEFLGAMRMEMPYPLKSATYSELRRLTADYIDDESVEEGILHFPDLAEYVAERTGLSMGVVLAVLAADAEYTTECTGAGAPLDLAHWASSQLRVARIALDELKRALASV
jgi:hypothetical protein